MAMKKTEGDNINLKVKRTTSILIVWLLVMGGFLVALPISQPAVEALDHTGQSAAWEDQNDPSGNPAPPGGTDYNGDIAWDGKVTWHAGAASPHILSSFFIVQDDYIFELEAGVTVQIDAGYVIQVGQTTGATFYSNGTLGSPVLIIQNVSGQRWGGIYIVEGSYGYMEYTGMTGGGVIYVLNSSLDMDYSVIVDMNSYGILASGSTVSVINGAIAYTAQPGIRATGSTLSVRNSYIANAAIAGIYLESSDALIDNSDLYGFNGSAGMDGGHAVYLTGFSSYVTISNNTIVGGSGGDDVIGGGGGGGGMGIFDSYYDGQLGIVDNHLIQGGKGGNNTAPDDSAGNGGIGVHIIPISDFASLNISYNTAILGGRGGDNNVLPPDGDGKSGNGGTALRIADEPTGSAGAATITYNTYILGGDGGHNHADWVWMYGGWTAGNGGDGISISNSKAPCSISIEENPYIAGGKGGNNTGAGDPAGSMPKAGEGGSGILLWNTTNADISRCYMIGGDGGNNTITGIYAEAGEARHGVVLYTEMLPFVSWANIMDSALIGGEGGDDWIGGLGNQGGPGSGGYGLYSYRGTGICTSLDLFGGKGGDNYGPRGGGGGGGYGAAFSNSFDWAVDGGTIIGGKGGDNFDLIGGGGSGGSAVTIGSNSDNIALNNFLSIVGGDGGDADVGTGPGDAAQATISVDSSTNINMLGNSITTGTGGYNASSGSYGQNGSYCIYCTSLGGSNTIVGNDITTNDRSGSTYGIRLDLSLGGVATISDNDVYTNNVGVYVQNSNDVTIGGNNRIFDNFIGIYLGGSDANIGKGNTISENGYGVYSINSNPTISGDQVINSSTIGLFFSSAPNAIVEESSIINSGVWSVYCVLGSSPKFYNCTIITGPGFGDFYINGSSHPWLLNTTFDKAGTAFDDATSNLTVNWFMHVKVVDTNNNGIGGATVWINDTYGSNVDIRTTDGQGWTRWIVVKEYVENRTGYEYYYTPHDVSALEGGRFGSTQSSMTLSRVVIVVLDGVGFDIMLKKGWNMISVPLNQTSTILEDVLTYIDGNYLAVQWYDSSDILDPWKHYHINKLGMNDLANIDRKMGIWIFMKSDDTLTIVGKVPVPSTTDINLKKGWNFVGYPSLTIRNAGNGTGEAFESISGNVTIVQYFDAFDPSNPWKEWDPGSFSPDDLIEVRPGYGLWIHATQDCTWSVDW